MYVSVAVCLHLNKSICSTCTYEWVWKPYSDVNAGCACASYSLIICNLCVMGREYLLFVFRLLESLFIKFPWITLEMTFVSIQLCALAFVPWFSFLHCHVSSSCTFSFSCLRAQLFVCANTKCFVNAVLHKCNDLCCYFEFLLICFIVIWLIEWNPSQSLINTYLAVGCWQR